MAYVRCRNHPVRGHNHAAEPIGFPNSGLICGRWSFQSPCNVAFIALNDQEAAQFNNGQRIFGIPHTNTAKVQASNTPLLPF